MEKWPVVIIIKCWVLVVLFSIFLVGFFPAKPGDSELASAKNLPPTFKRRVGKLVIVVIDALRADFVVDTLDNGEHFDQKKIKFLNTMIRDRRALGLVTRASPPTVTLPRIKAMTTGNIPGFVDIVRNFDTTQLTEDNLIRQWREQGRNIVFYGDDTWTKLFPGEFMRQDPTTSFFVSDFTDVDNNVTRHLDKELEEEDWDVMILHYLGLDHIGHLEGPGSELVQPKLDEMGNIIEKMWTTLKGTESKEELPPMMLVMGDHGMADGGSHGGASQPELLVPFVVLCDDQNTLGNIEVDGKEILQVDIVPTISALTGVPIPKWSLGSLIAKVLPDLSLDELLDVVKYNAEQIGAVVQSMGLQENSDGHSRWLEAKQMHHKYKEENDSDIRLVIQMYQSCIAEYQALAARNVTSYDLYQMVLPVVIIVVMLVTSANHSSDCVSSWSIVTVLSLCGCHALVCSATQSQLCQVSTFSAAKLLFFLLLLTTCILTIHQWMKKASLKNIGKNLKNFYKSLTLSSKFFIFINIVHLVSLFSSSFIEEEHQTFYFLHVSALCLLMFEQTKKNTEESESMLGRAFLSLLVHRILRNFNQTGDKWSHLPDLADYLHKIDNFQLKMILFISALTFLMFILTKRENSITKFSKILFVCLIFIQKYYIAKSNQVSKICFSLIFLNILVSKKVPLVKLFDLVLCLMLVVHNDINIIVISLTVFQFLLLHPLFSNLHQSIRPLAYIWLGRVSFFYLGNSNSLSSIDVGAGYAGMDQFSPVLVSAMLALHTYSGPVLGIVSYAPQADRLDSLYNCLYVSLSAELSVFAVLSTMLRYHLFVWTVFSPKLLYEGMYLLVITILITVLALLHQLTALHYTAKK